MIINYKLDHSTYKETNRRKEQSTIIMKMEDYRIFVFTSQEREQGKCMDSKKGGCIRIIALT